MMIQWMMSHFRKNILRNNIMLIEKKQVMGIPIDELFDTAISQAQIFMGDGIRNFEEVFNKLLKNYLVIEGKKISMM